MRTRPARQVDAKSGAGVYKIPCRECDQVYIGETGRDFKIRLGEHKSAVTHGTEKNAVFQHVKRRNHAIDWNNSAVIYHSDLESNRLVVESTLIKEKSTFNNTEGVLSIDSMSSAVILDSFPQLRG